MKIVTGAGRSRRVFELPCATIVNRSPEIEQKTVSAIVCDMLNITAPPELAAA